MFTYKDYLQDGTMTNIYDSVKTVFEWMVQYGIILIEFIGVAVLMYSVVKAVVMLFKKRDHLRLELARGIALSLEFKMGSELLRTLIVRDWSELLILGGIIFLRAAMAFLIRWEIQKEKE